MTQPDLPDWISTVTTAESPNLLASTTSTAAPYTSGTLDVSPFSSVNLALISVSPNINKFHDIALTWQDNGVTIEVDHYTVWGSQSANVATPPLTIVVPCKGNQLLVNIVSSDGVNATLTLSIFGSRRLVPRPIVQSDPLGNSPVLSSSLSHSLANGATEDFRVGPTQNAYQLTLSFNNAGPLVVTITACAVASGVFRETLLDAFNVATATVTRPVIYAPGEALHFSWINNGAAASNIQHTINPVLL